MPIAQILMTSNSGAGGGGWNGPPNPGSGAYQNFWPGSENWSAQGAPYDPGSNLSSVANAQSVWRRTTEIGYWSYPWSGGNDNPSIFNAGSGGAYDYYGGFGQTNLSDNYCCEWKGYLQAPSTGVYNFFITSDDVSRFWIGDGALNPESYNPHVQTNNSSTLNASSVSLTGGQWYPIRMRYQEWTGDERCQIFFGPANSPDPIYAMNHWQQYMCWSVNQLGYQ